MISVMRRLWSGQYRLVAAFWGFYCAGTILVFITAMIVGGLLIFVRLRPFGSIAFAVIFLGYFLIASVGVWRSADAYPFTRWWAIWPKVLVLLWGSCLVWRIVNGGAEWFIMGVMR